MTVKSQSWNLGYVDCANVKRICVLNLNSEKVYWPNYVESEGERWFIFYVDGIGDLDLVRGDSFADAYETYIDWAAEHRHIMIDEKDLKDYEYETSRGIEYDCGWTSDGKPVDAEAVQGFEVTLLQLEFKKGI